MVLPEATLIIKVIEVKFVAISEMPQINTQSEITVEMPDLHTTISVGVARALVILYATAPQDIAKSVVAGAMTPGKAIAPTMTND